MPAQLLVGNAVAEPNQQCQCHLLVRLAVQDVLAELLSTFFSPRRQSPWISRELADELGLIICVSHLPPGTSKWNLIEHRMFSLISENWSEEPLVSYEVMLQFIRHTKSDTGFCCRATLDQRTYATKVKVSKEQRASINMKPRRVFPKWNYVIRPHRGPAKPSQ